MIESILERIAVALERLATVHAGGAAPVTETTKPKKTKATTDAAAPSATQPATGTAPLAQPAQSSAPAASGPDIMTVTAEVVIDLANNYSRDAAVAILDKYGAKKVSQVKLDDLPKVLAEAKAAISAANAAKANESLV